MFSPPRPTLAEFPLKPFSGADSVKGSDAADGSGRKSRASRGVADTSVELDSKGRRNPTRFVNRHGLTDTPTHRSWMSMRQRCGNPNDGAWKNYGGRGIAVCMRWSVFENFLADMGLAPEGHEIERIDVNGNYEPGNCRWATTKEQANNRRTNRLITHRGRTRTLTQWAEELGLKMHTLYRRIVVKKMPLDEAMKPALMSASERAKRGHATRKRQKLLQLPARDLLGGA
jgi:hypothetical protein